MKKVVKMTKNGNDKQVTNNEIICDVISKSIKEIVDMSENGNFKQACCDLLKIANAETTDLEKSLKEYFSKSMVKQHPKKRSFLDAFFESEVSRTEDISLETLLKDTAIENIDGDVDIIEELNGFDRWRSSTSESSK